jgi:hypothetical protein
MSRTQIPVDARKLLVDRVVASRYIAKSARLRTLLVYLCEQVLEHNASEIHEQEVGNAVFGRPADYDTISDNIVRVHASMLRKRLEQYFSSEGRDEPVVIELPKGNYAPVFSDRKLDATAVPLLEPLGSVFPAPPPPAAALRIPPTVWLWAGLATVLAVCSLVLLLRGHTQPASSGAASQSAVHGLWSQLFAAAPKTDVVLDDEGVGLYQELTGTHIALSDYFNRNYLRSLGMAVAKPDLSKEALGAIVLKRQSSYASAILMWKLGVYATEAKVAATVHFARDYSFRELQVNNAVLLGNTVSNPWIEAFQDHLGLRWKLDPGRGSYYPVDTWAHGADSADRFQNDGDGYAMVALVPNLSRSGTVLILSASGGSAMNAAGDFLADNDAVARLKNQLPKLQGNKLPNFEALLRVKSRSRLPRDTSIVICRAPRT